MRVLDLFSGIGGFSLGLERAGMRTVAFCEVNEFCRAVLAKHWPGVPCLDDVRTADFPDADVICGGFPCQDISLAGKRAGLSGERSGLYREMVRAVCLVRPKFAIMENVAALLANGMGTVVGDMATNGYDAEWDCVSASDVGAPHGRDRVWIAFADANKFERPQRSGEAARWWQWSTGQVEAARNSDGAWELQPPRLLGDIRRRVDHAACSRARWERDWQTEFEAFRGMDDGIPDGLDRSEAASAVKALGNTVVPEITEIIGHAVMACKP